MAALFLVELKGSFKLTKILQHKKKFQQQKMTMDIQMLSSDKHIKTWRASLGDGDAPGELVISQIKPKKIRYITNGSWYFTNEVVQVERPTKMRIVSFHLILEL